jgi:flagellar basal-body rod protein FlgG
MAIIALNDAATGLRALSSDIDIIANNLSNAETTAFKAQRANFEDLMYQTLKQPGTQDAQGDISPTGIAIGLGTKLSNTQLDLTQGGLQNTDIPTDVAIQGPGFFRVKILSTIGDGFAYTRNGNFLVNANGQLVLNVGDGYLLDPPIKLPKNSTDVTIGTDGSIYVTEPGKTTQTLAGNFQLANFVNPNGLTLLGGSLYQESGSSGPPTLGRPGENGTGTTVSNFLEESNVDPVKELVTLIQTQRAFEMNSQSVQTADQALETVVNLRRS